MIGDRGDIPDSELAAELHEMLRVATRLTCANTDFAAALDRFVEVLQQVAPDMLRDAPPQAAARRSLACVLLREIWNRVPRPDNGFRPRLLARPGRNAPCTCGSGLKYKQCCAPVEDARPFDALAEDVSVLRYVLDDMAPESFAQLPLARMNPGELAFVGDQWLEEGRADAVAKLLQPLLAQTKKLDLRHEFAFDVLCNAYVDLDMAQEHLDLIDRVLSAPQSPLRPAALHRRCTVLSDAGDWDGAWACFAEARRLQPDHISLSHLEVTMLAAQGEYERASDRARYWLTRVPQLAQPEEDVGALMRLLNVAAANPQALLDLDLESDGDAADS